MLQKVVKLTNNVAGGSYHNLKTYGLSNEVFEICIEAKKDQNLQIGEIRMLGKSDSKGCTYSLGRHSAASVTNLHEARRGEKILGFQHGGMFVQGSGLNGCLTQEISIIKISCTTKTNTVIVSSIRADTGSLPFYKEGETLQRGDVPPAMYGHQLTLLNS